MTKNKPGTGLRVAYTIPEVAEALSLSRSSVYNMITRGELKVIKIGRSTRVLAAELDAFTGGSK